jgi:ubiquinone/menaquinone biosynthesis C-methylase UbiE
MGVGSSILIRTFGRPSGVLGRLGGVILARTNRRYAAWVVDLLGVRQPDHVLEIGFGPGVAIQMLAAGAAYVAGVDPSAEMLRQGTKRNAAAIGEGRVELHQNSADDMPFADGRFDKALAINSMQLWPDKLAGLRELSRVLRRDGQIALAFAAYSGQQREGVAELIGEAGFGDCRMVEAEQAFCVLASASSRT